MGTINEGTEFTQQVWSYLEEQLLKLTKENEMHRNEMLVSKKKGTQTLEEHIRNLNPYISCNEKAS